MNNTFPSLPSRNFLAGLVACGLLLLPPAGLAQDTSAKKSSEPQYDNYIEFAASGSQLSGDKANFEKLTNHNQNAWGGLSDFHYSSDLSEGTEFVVNAHALAGDEDYLFNLKLTKQDVGYLDLGYKSYRIWYDGNGGFFPANGMNFNLYDNNMHVDRSDLWFSFGTLRPQGVNFKVRYDYTTRKGQKDSTSWGDTSLTGGLGTRNFVPTFYNLDEKKHTVNASVFGSNGNTNWDLTGLYEKSTINDSLNIHRTPNSTTDRYATQNNNSDSKLDLIRGTMENQISEIVLLTAGVARYKLDANIDGSRIYGSIGYDPIFDPAYTRRQFHDEGFYNMSGNTSMTETLANLSLAVTPNANWTIVPAFRADKTSWGNNADYIETSVGSGPGFVMAQDETQSSSNKDFKNAYESLEVRYTGIKNVVASFTGDLQQGNGNLNEDLYAVDTGIDSIFRTTGYSTDIQKYAFTAYWYAQPGLNFTAQYYWKGSQNKFDTTRDSTNNFSADRYPAYITNQDFETNDFNLRSSWRLSSNVRMILRYDYQQSKIRTGESGLAFADSANMTTHIVGGSVNWSPRMNWYIQATGNLVYDRTVTPTQNLTGAASGLVLNSDNNYFNGGLMTGYAIDDQSDVTLDYSYYRANNFADNSARSMPYGADAKTHQAGLTWTRRLDRRTTVTVKYAFIKDNELTYGSTRDFKAQTIYAKVAYRF